MEHTMSGEYLLGSYKINTTKLLHILFIPLFIKAMHLLKIRNLLIACPYFFSSQRRVPMLRRGDRRLEEER
jgi:hypothetical protein